MVEGFAYTKRNNRRKDSVLLVMGFGKLSTTLTAFSDIVPFFSGSYQWRISHPKTEPSQLVSVGFGTAGTSLL